MTLTGTVDTDASDPDTGTVADVIIIGAGIAGASIGYWLAPHARVVVLERESQPGYHTTGRSAALFMESYGTAQVRALTMASRAFLSRPPAGFSASPILTSRGALIVGTPGQEPLLDNEFRTVRSVTDRAQRLDAAQACRLFPALRPDRIAGGVYEPDAADIDVHSLHQGYLAGLRRHGGQVFCDRSVDSLAREDGQWRVTAAGLAFRAPVVVNAAGAWCDAIAAMAGVPPIGLVPKRRAAFTFTPAAGTDVRAWPMCISVDHRWYIKPDAGVLLGSPANEDPMHPHDVQPEELDIATAIDHIQTMTTLSIRRPLRTWAGLRSFVADGDLVGGFDPRADGFFWLAAQGGYGIQTSAAMGETCAALVRGLPIPETIARFGITPSMLGPGRLRAAPVGAATGVH